MLLLEPPRLRAQIERRDVARVVDVDRRVEQRLHRLGQAFFVDGREPATPDPLERHARARGRHAENELLRGHFQGEDRDRQPLRATGVMLGELHGEGRLPDTRPRRQHDELTWLHAGEHSVHVGEARTQAKQAAVSLHRVEHRERLFDELGHRSEGGALALQQHLIEPPPGLLEQRRKLERVRSAEVRHLEAHASQLPPGALFADQP